MFPVVHLVIVLMVKQSIRGSVNDTGTKLHLTFTAASDHRVTAETPGAPQTQAISVCCVEWNLFMLI